MTFTKQIAPARQIDAFRSFAAQIKHAYIASVAGKFLVTIMQTNSNGLDCQWVENTEAEAIAALTQSGYAA